MMVTRVHSIHWPTQQHWPSETAQLLLVCHLRPAVGALTVAAAQAVATRGCYLFSKMVKVLRQNMRPFVREILHSIQGHLVNIATRPPPEAGPPNTKAGGPGGVKIATSGAYLPATDDRYYSADLLYSFALGCRGCL